MFRALGVALCLPFVDPCSRSLQVLVPTALDLVPLSFRLIRGVLCLGLQFGCALIGALARPIELGPELRSVLAVAALPLLSAVSTCCLSLVNC